jgi:hypothetical protein
VGGVASVTTDQYKQSTDIWGIFSYFLGLLVDSEIVLSTRYGKTTVFINKNLINRDCLSTRFDSW